MVTAESATLPVRQSPRLSMLMIVQTCASHCVQLVHMDTSINASKSALLASSVTPIPTPRSAHRSVLLTSLAISRQGGVFENAQ